MLTPDNIESTLTELIGGNAAVTIKIQILADCLQASREDVSDALSVYRGIPASKRLYDISSGAFASKTDILDYEIEIQKRA